MRAGEEADLQGILSALFSRSFCFVTTRARLRRERKGHDDGYAQWSS